MELPAISDGVRLILWIVVGLATAISVFVGNAFEENINYFFHKLAKKSIKGKAPEPIPWYIKAVSGTLFLIVIVGTAFASAAPDQTLEFIAQSLPTLRAPQGAAGTDSQTTMTPELTPTSPLAEALVQSTPSEVEAAQLDDPREALAALDILSELDFPADQSEDSTLLPVLATFSAPDANGDAFIASSLQDGSLGLFSLSEDNEFVSVGAQVVPENLADSSGLLFLGDGLHLLRSTSAGEISLWAFGPQGLSPSPQQAAVQETGINAITLAPDGESVALGLAHLASAAQADDTAIIFVNPYGDMEDKQLVLNSNQTAINDLSFTQNGSLLIAGRSPYIRWFDRTSAGSMISGGELRIPENEVSTVFASPNNPDLFYASGSSPKLHLASISQREVLYSSAALGGKVTAIAHHPALDMLAVGTEECRVYLLDATTLATLASPANLCTGNDQLSAAISSLSFSPDGHMLLAGNTNGMYLLNTFTKQPEPEPEPEQAAQIDLGSIALMGRVISWSWVEHTTLPGNVPPELLALPSIAALSGDEGNIIGAAFPDGSLALFTIDPESGLALIGNVVQGESSERISSLLFMPGGELLVTANADGELAVWTVAENGLSPIPLRKVQLAASINAIALSPDGQTLASGQAHLFGAAEKDDSVVAFNQPLTSDLRPQYTLMNTNQTSIADLAFTADGRLLVVGETPTIQIYALNAAGTRMDFLDGYNTQSVKLLTILPSPSNGDLVYVEVASERIGLVDLASSQVLQSSELLGGAVTAFAYHPSRPLIAVGTSTCIVHLLDAESLARIESSANLCEGNGSGAGTFITSLAFTPDGSYLVVTNSHGVILLNTSAELLPE